MIYMFFIGYLIGGVVGAFILACILLANKMCVVIKEKNKDEEIEVLTKANENLKVLYQDIVTQSEWHEEYYKKEIERLNKRIVALRETIRIANNNVLKDISMIKTIGMEKQEIIQRLFETSKILEGIDKE